MSRRSRRGAARTWQILLVAAGALLLAACAGVGLPPSPQKDPEARLRERASEYWESRKLADLTAQYGFQTPLYRENVTLSVFVRGKGATVILSYDIKEVSVKGGDGMVKLKVTYKAVHPMLANRPPAEKELEQGWVRVDGEWYLKER